MKLNIPSPPPGRVTMAQELYEAFVALGGEIPEGLNCLLFHRCPEDGGAMSRKEVYRQLFLVRICLLVLASSRVI